MSVTIKTVKDYFSFAIAIIACISGLIFWVQESSNEKVYRVEAEVLILKQELKEINRQNGEILRLIGKLEGSLSRRRK